MGDVWGSFMSSRASSVSSRRISWGGTRQAEKRVSSHPPRGQAQPPAEWQGPAAGAGLRPAATTCLRMPEANAGPHPQHPRDSS